MFKKVLATSALLAMAGSAAHAQFTVYSNVTNFSGQAFANGGAVAGATPITTLVADDINTLSGYGGQTITGFSFSVADLDAAGATITARARVRFYDTTGAGGGPGNYITGYSFNPIAFAAGVTVYGTTGVSIAIPTSGNFWAGITFDNVGATTTTVAQLNELGQGIFNPPTVGSSSSNFFQSTAPGSFVSNAPAGTIYSGFTGGTPGNFGWAFSVAAANPTPEPSQYAAFGLGILGVGALALRARRRGVTA